VVIPKTNPWQPLIDSLSLFSEDFMETREQPQLESREDIFE
jgi:antitoxin VapB